VTGNSDVRSIHCFDSRNDIDTTNSKYICDISTLKRQVTKYCNTQVVKSVAIDTAFIFRECIHLLVVMLSIVPLFLMSFSIVYRVAEINKKAAWSLCNGVWLTHSDINKVKVISDALGVVILI